MVMNVSVNLNNTLGNSQAKLNHLFLKTLLEPVNAISSIVMSNLLKILLRSKAYSITISICFGQLLASIPMMVYLVNQVTVLNTLNVFARVATRNHMYGLEKAQKNPPQISISPIMRSQKSPPQTNTSPTTTSPIKTTSQTTISISQIKTMMATKHLQASV